MLSYKEVYNLWQIMFDYCCWLRDGGEALYGSLETAMVWQEQLMIMMSETIIRE